MTSQPVGLSEDLAPTQVMRATVAQHDIAVWRSVSGVISAWHNRCPHRGMRLSHGFVRGESLACAYHGWHFNCEGYCHYIPAHPELTPPKTVQPVIYSVAEQGGLIWVDPQEAAQPVTLPEDTTAVRSLTMACDVKTVLRSLSTVPFVTVPFATRPSATKPSGPGSVTALVSTLCDSPMIVSINAADLSDGVIIAFQQSQGNRLKAHVLAHKSISIDDRIAVSRWLESVRRQAEASSSATP